MRREVKSSAALTLSAQDSTRLGRIPDFGPEFFA